MILNKVFKTGFIVITIFYLNPAFNQGLNKTTIPVQAFAAKINQQTNPQIIDVRTPEEFNINHINGAININMQKADYINSIKPLDKTKPVFIYAIQTSRPDVLAKQLTDLGYTEIYELQSGIAAWIGAGYPYFSTSKNTLTLKDYNKVITDNKLVLVDIGSKYCGICQKAKPILDSVKNEYGNAIKEVEIDVQDSPQLIAELKLVTSIPFVLIYNNGNIVLKRTGITDLKNNLESVIALTKSPDKKAGSR